MTQKIKEVEYISVQPVLQRWIDNFPSFSHALITSNLADYQAGSFVNGENGHNGQAAKHNGFASNGNGAEHHAEVTVFQQPEHLSDNERTALFDPENPANQVIFNGKWEQDEASCRAILERSKWTAQLLRERVQGTKLERGIYDQEGADIIFQWLLDIIPANGGYQYQAIDTQKYHQAIQQRNVYERILPHSFGAAEVAYGVGYQINRVLGGTDQAPIINPYKLKIRNLLHESQRMVTHDLKAHDALLPKVLQYAGLDPALDGADGILHPRVLDIEAETMSLEQLETLILWCGDVYTKADPENDPFATFDQRPHLRQVEQGQLYIMLSLLNYGDLFSRDHLEMNKGNYGQLLSTALWARPDIVQQYRNDLELLEVIPVWLSSLGIDLQAILHEVEGDWGELLTELSMHKQLPQRWIEAGFKI